MILYTSIGIEMKTKAERIADTKRVQKKRVGKLQCIWERDLSEKERGKLKDGNMSCGCGMCKPWKHKLGDKMKFSDKKRAKDDK